MRGRRRLLLSSVGAAAAFGLRKLHATSRTLTPLERIVDGIAPGDDHLPGALASGVAEVIATRIPALDPKLYGQVVALLENDRPSPAAMVWLTRQTFVVLYGSARHQGRGERGAFAALSYP